MESRSNCATLVSYCPDCVGGNAFGTANDQKSEQVQGRCDSRNQTRPSICGWNEIDQLPSTSSSAATQPTMAHWFGRRGGRAPRGGGKHRHHETMVGTVMNTISACTPSLALSAVLLWASSSSGAPATGGSLRSPGGPGGMIDQESSPHVAALR